MHYITDDAPELRIDLLRAVLPDYEVLGASIPDDDDDDEARTAPGPNHPNPNRTLTPNLTLPRITTPSATTAESTLCIRRPDQLVLSTSKHFEQQAYGTSCVYFKALTALLY
jgi:hypothetical protein